MQRGRVKKRSKRVSDIVVTAELKDIGQDLSHWRDTANMMAKKYPDHQYAVVKDSSGNYVCMPITPTFDRETIYKTGCVSGGDK